MRLEEELNSEEALESPRWAKKGRPLNTRELDELKTQSVKRNENSTSENKITHMKSRMTPLVRRRVYGDSLPAGICTNERERKRELPWFSLEIGRAENGISAIGYENGDLFVFDPRGEQRHALSGWSKLPTTTKSPRTALCSKPDKTSKHSYIVATGDTGGIIEHFHLSSGQKVGYSIQEDNEIYCIGYGQTGDCFAACGKKPYISLYNSHKQKIITKLGDKEHFEDVNGHTSRVYTVEFYRDGTDNIIVSGGWDSTIQIWDARAKSAIRRIIGVNICGNSILAYDGKIVSGSWRRSRQLQVFDLASGNLQAEYTTGTTEIYALSNVWNSSEKDIIAVGGGNSKEILIVDINTGHSHARLGPVEDTVTSLTLHQDDRYDDDSKFQPRTVYSSTDRMKITALSGQNLLTQVL